MARTASTGPGFMFSMSSASILARKIADENASVSRPATGPKPNSFTQKIAIRISWKVRPTTITPRAAR